MPKEIFKKMGIDGASATPSLDVSTMVQAKEEYEKSTLGINVIKRFTLGCSVEIYRQLFILLF
jgi:hypothetical protein